MFLHLNSSVFIEKRIKIRKEEIRAVYSQGVLKSLEYKPLFREEHGFLMHNNSLLAIL